MSASSDSEILNIEEAAALRHHDDEVSASSDSEILNIEEAAALLRVSVKTFNKVLHSEDIPARKIGREWKFSRQALIDWVGRGSSTDYYREDKSRAGRPQAGAAD